MASQSTVLLVILAFCGVALSQSDVPVPLQPILYDFNLTDIEDIASQTYHRINYYPEQTPAQYTYFPYLEGYLTFTNTFRLTKNVTWNLFDATTDVSPSFVSCNAYTNYCGFTLLVIENGGRLKLTSSGMRSYMTIVVKTGGVIELDPTQNVVFTTNQLVLYPGSTFISHPIATVNHTIQPSYPDFSANLWKSRDPFQSSSFLCLGCTIDIVSYRASVNMPASFTAYLDGAQFCIATTDPAIALNSTLANNPKVGLVMPISGNSSILQIGNIDGIQYTTTCGEDYVPLQPQVAALRLPVVNQLGTQFIYTYDTSSNVFINGAFSQRSAIIITGNASVTIAGASFDRLGATSTSPFDDTTWNGATLIVGNNIPDRYPITLLHVTNPVNITNNVFHDTSVSPTQYSTTPRFIIGAKRSFGTISYNAFLMKTNATGIGFLYGTEQFSVDYNTFTTPSPLGNLIPQPAYGTYPDVVPGNTAIYTVSPYIKLTNNSFQGIFQGSPITIEMLPNRAQLFGSSEPLIGQYANQTQNNVVPLNLLWGNFLWSGMEQNKFFRTSFPRIVGYPSTAPPFSLRLLKSIFYKIYGANVATTKDTVFNYDLVFDNSYVTGQFSRLLGSIGNMPENYVFFGSYRGLSVINSNVSMAYGQFTNANFRDLVHNENSLFTSNIFLQAQYSGNAPQLALKNSMLSYVDVTGSNSVSVYKVLPDPAIPLTSPTFSYTIIYDMYNTWNVTITVDGTPVITNLIYNSTRAVKATITIPNFTPGYHKVESVSFPLLKKYGGVDPGGYNYRYSLTYQANTVTNYIAQSTYNFYLGIDLNPNTDTRRVALPIFNQNWTRCAWVSEICQISGGTYSNPLTFPESVTDGTNIVNDTATVEMLSSVYGSNTGEGSSVTIDLPAGYYQVYLYYFNIASDPGAEYAQSITLPRFSLKINDQFVAPLTRSYANYGQYQKTEAILINSTSTKSYTITWGYNGIYTPLSGIEVYSSSSTPYPVPVDPETPATTGAATTGAATTGASTDSSTTGVTTGNPVTTSDFTITGPDQINTATQTQSYLTLFIVLIITLIITV